MRIQSILHQNIKSIKTITRTIIHLLHEPRPIKIGHLWIKSLSSDALNDQSIWITYKARAWLESYLQPTMSVFEYGSGGSTLFLSKKVHKLISIEHDPDWHKKVSCALRREGILNSIIVLCEPEKIVSSTMPSYGFKSYTSTTWQEYAGLSFERYVKQIEKYPDGLFDLVIVDGRARASCISHAINKISNGGYLMLDNSERAEYQETMSLLSDYKRIDFLGVGPYETKLWQTSIWEIRSIGI